MGKGKTIRRLNPFTDFGFKYIFGREQSKLLTNMETMNTVPKFAQTDPVFKELASISDYYALSRDERLSYDRSLKAYRDMKNR